MPGSSARQPFPKRLVAFAILALLAACAPDATAPRAPLVGAPLFNRSSRAPAFASTPGRYLVGLRGPGVVASFSKRVEDLGGSVVFVHPGSRFAIVDGLTSGGAAALARSNSVTDVEQDATVRVVPATGPELHVMDQPPGIASTEHPAEAGLFSFQWDMRAIDAEAAWDAGDLGSSSVTVAILDTGIDYDAYDLAGLVDLSRSVSFNAGDDTLVAQYYPGRDSVTDLNGHGTNVATQVSSDAVAFAGVTSRTTLMAVKVLGANGSGAFGDILRGVLWAADHGASVINMSLGGSFTKSGAGRFVGLINQVMSYATSRGVLIVVAAGNDATDLDHDKNGYDTFCSTPKVICVSAVGPLTPTGSPDVPAFYTNYGRSAITVAAPGGNASNDTEAWPWGDDNVSWVWSLCSKDLTVFNNDGSFGGSPCAAGNYVYAAIGTSQASPHVAGLAALLMAQYPGRSAAWIKNRIARTAIDLGQPGTDPFYGRGRIDVAAALGL